MPQIAKELRVSERSVERWRRTWLVGGAPALASKGQATRCRLSGDQLAELDRLLEAGPAKAGWEDQRWTLSRVRDLIAVPFRGAVHDPGHLVPAAAAGLVMPARRPPPRRARRRRHRGLEEGDLARRERTAAAIGAWIVFEDETGQSMRPPRSRTWARRGIIPVIRVEGVWSSLKRGPLANIAFTGLAHLLKILKIGLRKIQYRPGLIEGCLAETGLHLEELGAAIIN